MTQMHVPVPLAKQLVNLQHDVQSESVDSTYIETLANRLGCTELGERIQSYLYSGNADLLDISAPEAFKAVVYRQTPVVGAPVMSNGDIVPSPDHGSAGELPVLFARSTLFQKKEVLTLYWHDEPLERTEVEGVVQERVLHAPLHLQWEGNTYELLCETINRSFYVTGDVPAEIQPWISLHAQERTTLAVGLKRQGFPLSSLIGIHLNVSDVHDDELDLGVCVLPDEKIATLNGELGLDAAPYQGTIWFDDGSYFKGTIQCTTSAGIPVGWYGGIKRPYGAKGSATSTRGSILDSYTMVPWTPSLNRQQTDYADIQLPVRQELPSQEVIMKAASGFPAYVQQLNDQILSSCGKVFKRVRVRGVAGKVALGNSNKNVQFIVRGPKVHPGVRRMAFLFSPSLPVHTELISVRVEFFPDGSMYGNLIQLNVSEGNSRFVSDVYVRHCGRDADGDGVTLSNDPVVLDHAVPWEEVEIHDTTQYKSVRDEPTRTYEEAIRTSTERVRLYSSKIGVYDKLARRIYRQDPELMTPEVRTILTEAIQRSISATKKNSGADRFDGYFWLLDLLPAKSEDWLFNNVHDDLDAVGDNVRALLNARRSYSEEEFPLSTEYKEVVQALDDVREVMPDHYLAGTQLLELVQNFPKDQYRTVKVRGRTLWATQQARANPEVISDVQTFIAQSKNLWRSVHQNDPASNPGFGYIQAVRVIRTWAHDLSKRVNSQLLIGAMCTEFSLNLLGHVLDLDDLTYAGLSSGVFIPLSTDQVLSKGMLVSKGAVAALLAHPVYADVLDRKATYRIEKVYPLSSTNWIPRTSSKVKQGRYLVNLREVIK